MTKDMLDGILFYEKKASEMSQYAPQTWDYPETLIETLKVLQDIWGISERIIPQKFQRGKYNNWVLQLQNVRNLFSSDAIMLFAMKRAYDKYRNGDNHFFVCEPASIVKLLKDTIAELRREEKRKVEVEQKKKEEDEKGNLVNPNKFRKLRGE
jgi:hypothetical protein